MFLHAFLSFLLDIHLELVCLCVFKLHSAELDCGYCIRSVIDFLFFWTLNIPILSFIFQGAKTIHTMK